jgi:internalin A
LYGTEIELKKWLKPLEQRDLITVWDDQKIKAGSEWRHEIEKALASAKAAVLLISIDFLNSEFIANNELPQLLNAAQQRGLHIFWIAVRPSMVDETAIGKYQAAHKEPPLAELTEAERDKHFLRIYKQIKEVVEA